MSDLSTVATRALTAASTFHNRGFQRYFVQHVLDDFAQIEAETDTAAHAELVSDLADLAGVLERQAIVSAVYGPFSETISTFSGFKV